MHNITMSPAVNVEALPAIIWQHIRVITTELLARLYGTEDVRIRQNHARNTERFVHGTHYFRLEGDELRTFKKQLSSLKILSGEQTISKMVSRARSLILWTERGAARHAKMLDTEAAWEVFEKLEDHYFSVKEIPNARDVRFDPENGSALQSVLTNLVPAELLPAALSAIQARMPVQSQPTPEELLESALAFGHWYMSVRDGRIMLKPIPERAMLVESKDLAELVKDPCSVSICDLPAIMAAASERLVPWVRNNMPAPRGL